MAVDRPALTSTVPTPALRIARQDSGRGPAVRARPQQHPCRNQDHCRCRQSWHVAVAPVYRRGARLVQPARLEHRYAKRRQRHRAAARRGFDRHGAQRLSRIIRATNQGAHIKIVINDISVPPYTVYAKSAIKTVADLRGKTISIGGAKDVTLIYVRPLLAAANLAPRRMSTSSLPRPRVIASLRWHPARSMRRFSIRRHRSVPPTSASSLSAKSRTTSTNSPSPCGRRIRIGRRATDRLSLLLPGFISTGCAGSMI